MASSRTTSSRSARSQHDHSPRGGVNQPTRTNRTNRGSLSPPRTLFQVLVAITSYLPTPLTEAELADVADTAIAQVAEEIGERPGLRQMGQVMKAATAIAAGKADGARLSAAVKDRL